MFKRTLTLLAALPVFAVGQDVQRAVSSITEADVRQRIGILADDSMLGRDTPSPELEQTANYIAGQFYEFGLRPMGDAGSYLQRYPLSETGYSSTDAGIYVNGTRTAALGSEAQVVFARSPQAEISGDAVLVTGFPSNPAEVRGLDVAGKIAIAVVAGSGESNSYRALISGLFNAGTAGVVIVNSRSDEEFFGLSRNLSSLGKGWSGDPRGRNRSFPPILEIRRGDVDIILGDLGVDMSAAAADVDAPLRATPLTGTRIDLNMTRQVMRRASAPNVVAFLSGSDPELRNEYIVLSAHMDHIGVGAPNAEGDSINNGADDDASGTAAIIELAQAYAGMEAAPRRSMIFLTVSGEEKGLWGSEYFSENLPVPASQIVANLNIDMIGRNWPDTIVVIGKEHSDLGETLNEVNSRYADLGMTAIDDIWPEENFYQRSDHFNFARKGVPVLFFFNGTHDDYHGRDDEPDRIGYDKHIRITKLIFHLGLEVANRDERPQWNPDSYAEIVQEPSS